MVWRRITKLSATVVDVVWQVKLLVPVRHVLLDLVAIGRIHPQWQGEVGLHYGSSGMTSDWRMNSPIASAATA
jgi:hypothetical protein